MDPVFDINIEEIYIPSKRTNDNYLCENFVIYPEGKEEHGGYISGIIELRATPENESEKIIQNIVNTLKEEYYRQITTSPDPEKLNLETVFEHTLQKTNNTITEMIQIGQINFSPENLNYLITVSKKAPNSKDIDLVFCHKGLISAYLLHRTQQNNYKVINIIDNPHNNNHDEQIKIFTSILSGKIFYKDTLYFSTEIFNNFLPSHKVNKIITENDLPEAIGYFKTAINSIEHNSNLSYSAIFINLSEKSFKDENPASQSSMNKLIETKESTEKYLTPTIASTIRNKILGLVKGFKPKTQNKIKSPIQSTPQKTSITKAIIKSFKKSLGLFKFMGEIVTRKRKVDKQVIKETLNKPVEAAHKIKKKAFNLHQFSKFILITTVLLIIIFTVSLMWINNNKKVEAIREAYLNQIKEIEDTINNANIRLIYKNDKESLVLINQASLLLANLPKSTPEEIENYDNLNTQITTQKNKLLHLERKIPQLVTEIISQGVPSDIQTITRLKNGTLAIGANNTVYIINPTDKKIIKELKSDISNIVFSSTEDENTIFTSGQNSVLGLEDEKLESRTIDWGNIQIKDLYLYNSHIYALDADQEQIFKYRNNGSGYNTKQAWITNKGNISLKNAVDLTIDGNIFVLTNQGTIYKFYAGDLTETIQVKIEPALNNPTQIVKKLDYNYIYILDPDSKRILILSQRGELIKQLLFDSLDQSIKSFEVDESSKSIWISSGNKLYFTKY